MELASPASQRQRAAQPGSRVSYILLLMTQKCLDLLSHCKSKQWSCEAGVRSFFGRLERSLSSSASRAQGAMHAVINKQQSWSSMDGLGSLGSLEMTWMRSTVGSDSDVRGTKGTSFYDFSALPLPDAGAAGIGQHSPTHLFKDVQKSVPGNGGPDLLTAGCDGKGHLQVHIICCHGHVPSAERRPRQCLQVCFTY